MHETPTAAPQASPWAEGVPPAPAPVLALASGTEPLPREAEQAWQVWQAPVEAWA